MKDKIIIALDGMNRSEALSLAKTLSNSVWGFKANDLLLQCGMEILSELKKYGKVFADPKLHDIPNTVGNSVRALAAAGADIITVHASGGPGMIAAALKEAGNAKILAITVLTSLDDATAQDVYLGNAAEVVERLGSLAQRSSIHGVVCSPRELQLFSKYPVRLKVTPGVRPSWYGKADDQTRVMSPAEAVRAGATHLVIGRPVTGDSDPQQAVNRIVEELQSA